MEGKAGSIIEKWDHNFSNPYPYAVRVLVVDGQLQFRHGIHNGKSPSNDVNNPFTSHLDATGLPNDYHLVVNYSKNLMTMYMNGISVDSRSIETIRMSNSSNISIGLWAAAVIGFLAPIFLRPYLKKPVAHKNDIK